MELVDIEPEQDAGQKETCTAIGYVGLEEGLDSIAGLTIAFPEDIAIAPVIGVEDADSKGYDIGQEVMEADVDADCIYQISNKGVRKPNYSKFDKLSDHKIKPAVCWR
jgi:hypothetical protein